MTLKSGSPGPKEDQRSGVEYPSPAVLLRLHLISISPTEALLTGCYHPRFTEEGTEG